MNTKQLPVTFWCQIDVLSMNGVIYGALYSNRGEKNAN